MKEKQKKGLLLVSKARMAWEENKGSRLERRGEEKENFQLQAVRVVERHTGKKHLVDDALEILKKDGQVIYKILMSGFLKENEVFHPEEEEHELACEVLGRRKNDAEKKELVDTLAKSFFSVYQGYRTQFHPGFGIPPTMWWKVCEGAALSFRMRVSPAQLISYWAGAVRQFSSMQYVPLNFVCAHPNIDRVASESPLPWEFGAEAKEKRKRTPVQKRAEAEVTRDIMSAFGKEGDLDPRIRSGLTAAGIDVSQYNNKFLVSFQVLGRSYSVDPTTFLAGASAPIVKWIAENIYG